MTTQNKKGGYTIVETMIFLVVSASIFISAVAMFNGRQQQVQYEQGVRNLDLKITEAINAVSVGQSPATAYACTVDNFQETLRLTPDSNNKQGTNDQCVFAGKALEIDSDETTYELSTILAARPGIGSSMSLEDEAAKLTAFVDQTQTIQTSWGLRIKGMINDAGDNIDTVLFLSSLGAGQEGNPELLASGIQDISLYTSPALDRNTRIIIDNQQPIYLCLESSNGSKQAVITFGKDGRQLNTTVNQDLIEESHPCLEHL